ncbi:MAG: CDP-alcohol phosphatidyltransferase family protein [Nocardioidaceae bacterium]
MNGARVPSVQRGPLIGLLSQVLVLCALDATLGLDRRGWAVGLTCGGAVCLTVTVALVRYGRDRLGPADRVTLARAILAGGVAALVVGGQSGATGLVAVASATLVLDRVDGEVARRTHTVSRFGGAFDMEVDAFLILVLSVYVARSVGPWVLVIGAARYALWVAARALPWLRNEVPTRPWAKVVAAVQGIVLVWAAAGVPPGTLTVCLLLGALALLTVSFTHQVWWLRTHPLTPAPLLVEAGT